MLENDTKQQETNKESESKKDVPLSDKDKAEADKIFRQSENDPDIKEETRKAEKETNDAEEHAVNKSKEVIRSVRSKINSVVEKYNDNVRTQVNLSYKNVDVKSDIQNIQTDSLPLLLVSWNRPETLLMSEGHRNDLQKYITTLLDPSSNSTTKKIAFDEILQKCWMETAELQDFIKNNSTLDVDSFLNKIIGISKLNIIWTTEISKNLIQTFKLSKNPFEDTKKQYINASEDDKIQLVRFFSQLLNQNYDLVGQNTSWDVSNETMTNALKTYLTTWEKMPAGICRHIHAVTAQLLQDLWMEAGIITTNSTSGHIVTLWKKSNGEYFIIDYETMYTGKDLKEMQAKYLAAHGSMDLMETVATPDGKVLGFVQTFLEEAVSKNASVSWTNDIEERSKIVAEAGSLGKVSGQNISANAASNKNANISLQHWWKTYEVKTDFTTVNSTEWNLQSVGIGGKKYFQNNTLAIWGKVAQHNITFDNEGGKTSFSWQTLNISGEKVKNIFTSNNSKLNVVGVSEITWLFSNREGKAKWSDIVQDARQESALTIAWSTKKGNFEVWGNVGIKEITDFKNQREDTQFKPYVGLQAWGNVNYAFSQWGKVGVSGEYKTIVGEQKFNVWVNTTSKSGNTNFSANYEQKNSTNSLLGGKEIKAKLGIEHSFSEKVKGYISWSYEKRSSGHEEKSVNVGVKVNF